jgi:hypothetical protein
VYLLRVKRVQKLRLVTSHDTQQVDAADDDARRRKEIGIVLAQHAVDERTELDGVTGLQSEALGAGPHENCALGNAVQQLVLVAQRLRLNFPEVACQFVFRHAQLAAGGEQEHSHGSQQLVGELWRLHAVVRGGEQSVRVDDASCGSG